MARGKNLWKTLWKVSTLGKRLKVQLLEFSVDACEYTHQLKVLITSFTKRTKYFSFEKIENYSLLRI